MFSLPASFLVATALTLVTLSGFVVAPIPSCSPLAFINRVVESDEAAWLFAELPGHPAPPCRYSNPHNAPRDEKSLLWFFFSDTNRIQDEVRRESFFWSEKGIPRLNRRFWTIFDGTDSKKTKDVVKHVEV